MSDKLCIHCGAKLDPNARFCPSCGKPVETDAKELIKCEDCGRQFPSDSKACPYCGCPVTTPNTSTAPQQRNKQANAKKKNTNVGKTIITIVLFTSMTMLIIFGGYFGYTKWKVQREIKERFAYAASLYNAGDYTGALQVYESFENHSEAEDLANKCRYQVGMAAMTTGSYKEAKDAFLTISEENYGNINELIAQCDVGIKQLEEEERRAQQLREEEEKRAQCADDKFLKDLESVVNSLLQTNMLIPDETLAVNNSLKLDKYKNATFYDERLGTTAYKLVNYFDVQKENVQDSEWFGFKSELQYLWCSTNSNIATSLYNLYDKYGFMKDNAAFVSVFVADRYWFSKAAGAIRTISDNILDSFDENGAWHDGSYDSSYMLIHNKTNYTISVKFYYTDYVSGTNQYLGSKDYIANSIPPQSDYYIYSYPADYNYDYATTVHTDWEVLSIK